MKRPHIMVVDPGVRSPELDALNHLIELTSLPVTYHLPALFGVETLKNDTENIAGLVIFGSASSVNDRFDWQKKLEDLLIPVIEKKTPTFGICYGHQMLAYMFGGKVDFLHADQHSMLGFREVRLKADELWGNQEIKGNVCVSHNEFVSMVPDCMTILGSSQDVPTDALKHKTLPVWSSQFHPEARPHFLEVRGYTGVKEECHQFGYSLLAKFFAYVEKVR